MADDKKDKLKALDLAMKLVNFKKVKVILFPDDRDVNDLGKKAVMKMIYNTHYQNYHELVTLKNNL